jgi:hypothetical protein
MINVMFNITRNGPSNLLVYLNGILLSPGWDADYSIVREDGVEDFHLPPDKTLDLTSQGYPRILFYKNLVPGDVIQVIDVATRIVIEVT